METKYYIKNQQGEILVGILQTCDGSEKYINLEEQEKLRKEYDERRQKNVN